MKRREWILALVIASLGVVAACDTLSPDADAARISIDNRPVYFVANTSGFIDLGSRILSPKQVRLEVTLSTKQGSLVDVGKGLLQYAPFGANKSSEDSFQFSIYNSDNQLIGTETLGIRVNADSTSLPCAIYTRNDYAYSVHGPVTVDVLTNDYICSGEVSLSIHQPDASFAPSHGAAVASGRTVIYTPSSSFTGTDKVIYKLSPSGGVPVFGVLFLSSSAACEWTLQPDNFKINGYVPRRTNITFDVLANDKLCTGSFNQLSISTTPVYGKATFEAGKLVYTTPDTVRSYPFEDRMVYQVCIDGSCRTNTVTVQALLGASCNFAAKDDSFDLSQNNMPTALLDVLNNDSVCEGVASLVITRQPRFGVASVQSTPWLVQYVPEPTRVFDDTLQYKICNMGTTCSIATVIIKRKP